MYRTIRNLWTIAVILCLYPAAFADFDAYLKKPEPAYKWEKKDEKKVDGGTIYNLHLVSQTWQNITWEHSVQVFYPDNLKHPEFCVLLNTGGNPNTSNETIGLTVSKGAGTVFVVLYNIPKQPLFNNLYEDALIVYTWQKFMETGDESWPLHFPMAKAVIKCMDAVQDFVKSEKKTPIKDFMITGASKRGWTTWLVGASKDPRVKAIAPMVIDTLNIPAQIPNQIAAFGTFSEQIADYTGAGMMEQLNTPKGRRLLELEDPYSYRDRYTMPKLIINGTNDRYWALDALNFYWDGLKEPKWVLYVPNSGHGLEDRVRVFNTMSAFAHLLASKKQIPRLNWAYREFDRGIELTITSDQKPKAVRIFKASSATKDFRNSKWTFEEIPADQPPFKTMMVTPVSGFAACFGELEYEIDGKTFTLSTQIRIVGKVQDSVELIR